MQVETFYEFHDIFPLNSEVISTEEAIKEPIERLTKRVAESQIFYNSVPLSKDETLEKLIEGNKDVTADIFQTMVRIPVLSVKFQNKLNLIFPGVARATQKSFDQPKNGPIQGNCLQSRLGAI